MTGSAAHITGRPGRPAEGHHQGQQYSGMFDNILDYLRESGAEMGAGHTMQIGETRYMQLRDPSPEEYFLDGPGKVYVAAWT